MKQNEFEQDRAYQEALDQLQFSQEAKARMTRAVQEQAAHRPARRLRSLLTAPMVAVMCVLLLAAAVAPSVWKMLQEEQGNFSPYAHAIQGAVQTDQGIEMQVLSVLMDDVQGYVYFSVQDVEGDRLDRYLTLRGTLNIFEELPLPTDPDTPSMQSYSERELWAAQMVSYDPASKTALFRHRTWFGEDAKPLPQAQFRATGLSAQKGRMGNAVVSCAGVTDEVLASLPAQADRIVDLLDPYAEATEFVLGQGQQPLQYDEDFLPQPQVVLAPGLTPMNIEGCDDMTVSSMGFASDGCLHVRLAFAPGVSLDGWEQNGAVSGSVRPQGADYADADHSAAITHLVEDGLDIAFPLVHREEAGQLAQVQFWGSYTRPGVDLNGEWTMDFPMEYHRSTVLDWTGTIGSLQVSQVTVSPLTVTMSSSGGIDFKRKIYAQYKDGTKIFAESGTSGGLNIGHGEEAVWDNYSTWSFTEPVEVEKIAFLWCGGVEIPMKAGETP